MSDGGALEASPNTEMAPVLGNARRAIKRIIVDLPQPDGPTTATNSPSSMLRSTCSSATTPPAGPKRLVTPTISIPDCAGVAGPMIVPPVIVPPVGCLTKLLFHIEHRSNNGNRAESRALAGAQPSLRKAADQPQSLQ